MENATLTKLVFKPRARIMLQLGDQLIKNESIALLELIKNSYDADARNVSITVSKIDNPEEGSIVIKDDGTGMDINIIKKVWMEPGSDFRAKLFKKRERSKKYKRLPLGEKGIGRFGAHKLGKEIELVSRMKGKDEVAVSIDWSIFRDSKYLEDVPIRIYNRKPEVFEGNKTGTRITIRKLKCIWNRGMVRDIYRSVNSLCSPFSAPSSFKVKLNLCEHEDWLEGLLSWKEIKNYALYYVRCIIKNDEIKIFSYRFTPWETMPKLQKRYVNEKNEHFQKRKKMVEEKREKGKKILVPIDLSYHDIGEIRFEAYVYDRTAKILSLGLQDKKGFREYLNENGGIRVYRDGVRVYDYGEPGNDWLELGTRRVNIPTKRISNNIVLGAIHLKRNQSSSLVEKTNREGLIKRPEIQKELIKYIDRIERDYEYINENLLKSAGAGLNLSIVIHEVEKIVGELLTVLEKGKASERLIYLARHLSNLIEGYTYIIRGSGSKKESLAELIVQALFNVEYRLRVHGVDIVMDYDKPLANPKVKCAKRFVINNIMNIIDNSIWWLNYYGIKNKKIYITISEEIKGHTSIIIADNGKGFSLPTEDAIKPFYSGKPGDAGMGIGLHIVSETMKAQKGFLLFPDWGDFSVPDEYKDGAIIGLCFKQ
jgi:signal transduction histidine kinase